MFALHGVKQCGYEVTPDGKLLLGNTVDLIINKDKARGVAVMLVDKYYPEQIPYILETISNRLISRFILSPHAELYIRQFYAMLIRKALSLKDADTAAAIQIIAEQALNIIAFIKQDIPAYGKY